MASGTMDRTGDAWRRQTAFPSPGYGGHGGIWLDVKASDGSAKAMTVRDVHIMHLKMDCAGSLTGRRATREQRVAAALRKRERHEPGFKALLDSLAPTPGEFWSLVDALVAQKYA